ncbi:hypothetical protein ILYODFUR_012591 [Ilyodon furcidens]|uniref:Uncharacterized protein n=1 Tax=Ilyodon furcidens TaxID=33524 RepID=A0ABV0URG3_9TELE
MREEVELVEEYKYLSVHLYNRLDWRCSSEAVPSFQDSNTTVSSVRGFYRSVVTQTVTGDPSCPQPSPTIIALRINLDNESYYIIKFLFGIGKLLNRTKQWMIKK